MQQTMVEQLFSRKNVAGTAVKAGDVVTARIDGAMCHYHATESIHELAIKMGFKDGLPRVWDPEKIFVLVEHYQPAFSQKVANDNAIQKMLQYIALRIDINPKHLRFVL